MQRLKNNVDFILISNIRQLFTLYSVRTVQILIVDVDFIDYRSGAQCQTNKSTNKQETVAQ